MTVLIIIITILLGYTVIRKLSNNSNKKTCRVNLTKSNVTTNVYQTDFRNNSICFSLSYKVTGTSFRGGLPQLHVGDDIFLQAEPTNRFDKYAVKVLTNTGKHIGYIERKESYSISKNIEYIKGAEISKIVHGDSAPWITIDIYFSHDDMLPEVLYDELLIDGIDNAVNRLLPRYPDIVKAERMKKGRAADALNIFLSIAKDDDTEIYPEHECIKLYRKLKQYDNEIEMIQYVIQELDEEKKSILEPTQVHLYEFEIAKYQNRLAYVEGLRANKLKRDEEKERRKANPQKRGPKTKKEK